MDERELGPGGQAVSVVGPGGMIRSITSGHDGDSVGTLARMREAGKIQNVRLSNLSVAEIAALEASFS